MRNGRIPRGEFIFSRLGIMTSKNSFLIFPYSPIPNSYIPPRSNFQNIFSDVEENNGSDNEDNEDFGGPKAGDDGLGPIAAKNFFDESRHELGGRLYAETKQDEGEEQQSPRFKSMQWMHRNILALHRQVEVLRQKRADLGNRVQELMQRKGLA